VRRLRRTNHYERLGVRRDATAAELRQAYRRKALDAHPDRRVDGSAAADVMAAINDAWDVLGDPTRRAEYDRLLSADAPARARPATPPPRHATAARATAPEDEREFELWSARVDRAADLRRFRMLMTAVVVVIGLIFLLVFVFIIWPKSA